MLYSFSKKPYYQFKIISRGFFNANFVFQGGRICCSYIQSCRASGISLQQPVNKPSYDSNINLSIGRQISRSTTQPFWVQSRSQIDQDVAHHQKGKVKRKRHADLETDSSRESSDAIR